MGGRTSRLLTAGVQGIGLCVILPLFAGFLGFLLIPAFAHIYRWLGGHMADESLGLLLVFFAPPACAGVVLVFALIYVAIKRGNP